MKRRWLVLVAVLVVLTALVLVSCAAVQPAKETQNSLVWEEYDGMSYFSFGDAAYGMPSGHNEKLAEVVSEWRASHPDKTVLDITVAWKPATYASSPRTYGVRIFWE